MIRLVGERQCDGRGGGGASMGIGAVWSGGMGM